MSFDTDATTTPVAPPRAGAQALLRVLVLADLAAGRPEAPRPLVGDELDAVMAEMAPAITLRVPNRLGVGPAELACTLCFQSREDFTPVRLARAHPVLAQLLAVRQLLATAQMGHLGAAELGERVRSTLGSGELGTALREHLTASEPAPRPPAGGSAVDSLLGMVEVAAPAPAATGLVGAIASTFPPGSRTIDAGVLDGALRTLDQRLTLQLAALADVPAVRELEATWRGLELLLRRVEPGAPIALEVQPTGRADLLDAFYDTHFEREHTGAASPPLGLVVLAFAFDRSPRDGEELQHAARMAASLGVPFVAEVSAEFFGVKQPALVATLPDLVRKCRGPEYAKWNRLRADDSSLWLALAFNRPLLRPAWGEPGAEVAGFAWDAPTAGASNRPLWGSGALALATAVLQGYAAAGLHFPVAGPDGPAVLTGLPTRLARVGKAEPVALAVEVALGEQRALELVECGFVPLVGTPGRDQASFLSVPSTHTVARFESEEATTASFRAATLPYQLFASAAARALQTAAGRCGGGLGEEGVKALVREHMLEFLGLAEPAPVPEEVEVDVAPALNTPHLWDVTIRLRPVFPIYGGPVDLLLGTPVAR